MRRHAACLAILVAFVSTGSVRAHHSLANYDTTQAVRVKGTIVAFHRINPHSFIFLEQKTTDGSIRRWAVEDPSGLQLNRKGVPRDGLKPGDETMVMPDGHEQSWGDYGVHKCFAPEYKDQHSK